MMNNRLSLGLLVLVASAIGVFALNEVNAEENRVELDEFLVAQAPVAPKKKVDDRPTFFDGIRRIIGDTPTFDDNEATEGLVESLNRAEKIFKEVRQSNREAIRGMNRQVRVGQARQSPHIILITLPQLRFDQLSGMNRLNGIRRSGITFTNYYAPSENLTKSRWSMLTGRLAAQAPKDGNLSRQQSLAEIMWKSGYETATIGTWASNQHPIEVGFEHWTGFPSSSGTVATYPEFFFTQSTRAKIVGGSSSGQPNSQQLISDEVTSFLSRHQKSSRQFFLHVGLPFLQGTQPNENMKNVDRVIGEIVDSVNNLGLAGRVCLMVVGETSHHVSAEVEKALPAVNQKLAYSKSGMSEGNLRTPLIVFWGTKTKRGSVSKFPCTGIDILPTLMTIAQTQKKRLDLPGVSLSGELRGKPQKIERLLYWKMSDNGQAARRGRWKVILRPQGKVLELYDLELDPSESRNIADQHPDIVGGFIVTSKPAKRVRTETL